MLDVGCGDGFLLGRAAERCELAVGVEVEPSGVALAQKELSALVGCTPLRASGEALPFAAGSFDAVVMADVIEHLEDPHATLREATRTLRPGGWIIVTTPRRLPNHWWDRTNHVREYSSNELRELLAPHFATVDMTHFISLRWWAVRKRLGKGFLRFWSRTLFNPFLRTSAEPKGFGHLLAVGRGPGGATPEPAASPGR